MALISCHETQIHFRTFTILISLHLFQEQGCFWFWIKFFGRWRIQSNRNNKRDRKLLPRSCINIFQALRGRLILCDLEFVIFIVFYWCVGSFGYSKVILNEKGISCKFKTFLKKYFLGVSPKCIIWSEGPIVKYWKVPVEAENANFKNDGFCNKTPCVAAYDPTKKRLL